MAHWHPGPVFREKWFARQSRGARRIEFYAFSASISPPRTRQTMLVAVERGVKQALEAWDNLRLAAWEQCRPRLHLHHCHDLHAVRSVSALTLTLAASFRAQLPKQMTGKMVCNVCVFFWLSWSVARVDHLRSGMIFTNQYKSDIWWGLPISSDSFCSEVKSIRTSSHSRYFTTKHVGPMLASESLRQNTQASWPFGCSTQLGRLETPSGCLEYLGVVFLQWFAIYILQCFFPATSIVARSHCRLMLVPD